MPLQKGKSQAAFEANLETELAAGKKRDQALAIAYSVQRRSGQPKPRKPRRSPSHISGD